MAGYAATPARPHPRARLIAPIAALLTVAVLPVAAGGTGAPARASVIVQAASSQVAARAVAAAGGTITYRLPIVKGVAADVPASGLRSLAAAAGVRAVTPNHPVHFQETTSTTNTSTIQSVFARETNADRLWSEGTTGRGVRVALIDTGVSPVADVAGRIVPVPHPHEKGKLAACVNFSGESHCDDSYGHGTFVAGLIAGNGALSQGRYKGVAPGAEIVSLKIAGKDGSADVTKVLAAIQYVVSFKHDLGIDVLNLSLGTNSTVSYRVDPLNYAVQQAWLEDIVVVVSASNRGPGPKTISKPGDDPLVVTVGAVDDRETPAISDDRLPKFSGRGPTATDGLAKPDVVAPGGRVISLRSPGSTIEELAPGRGINAHYRRGSGTSMSSGVVSGVAALILSEHSDWSPDRVKFALMATARKVAARDVMGVGAGLVDAYAASRSAPPGVANTGVTVLSDGTGTLDGSRGGVRVSRQCNDLERAIDPECDRIHGDETAQRMAFDAAEYRNGDWTGSSWYTSQWNSMLGSSWYGSSWYGSSWYGSSWYGSSWYGEEETQTSYGAAIPGSSWYGAWD